VRDKLVNNNLAMNIYLLYSSNKMQEIFSKINFFKETTLEEAFVTQCSSYFIQNYELSKCSRKRVKKLASLAELPSADQYSTLYAYGCMLSTLYDF